MPVASPVAASVVVEGPHAVASKLASQQVAKHANEQMTSPEGRPIIARRFQRRVARIH